MRYTSNDLTPAQNAAIDRYTGALITALADANGVCMAKAVLDVALNASVRDARQHIIREMRGHGVETPRRVG